MPPSNPPGRPPATPPPHPGPGPSGAPARRLAICRVTTRCATRGDFIAAFARFVDASSLFVPAELKLEIGRLVRLQVLLRDDSVVFVGVVQVLERHADASNRYGRAGIRFRLRELDPADRRTHNELLHKRPPRSEDMTPPPVSVATPAANQPREGAIGATPTHPFTDLSTNAIDLLVDAVLTEEELPTAGPAPVEPRPAPIPLVTTKPAAAPAPPPVAAAVPPSNPSLPRPSVSLPPPSAARKSAGMPSWVNEPLVTPVEEVGITDERPRWRRRASFAGAGVFAALGIALAAGAWRSREIPPPPLGDSAQVEMEEALPTPVAPAPAPAPAVAPPAPVVPAPVPAPPAKAETCVARVESVPSGARVLVGQKLVGRTPLAGLELPCGPATITFDHPRYRRADQRFELTPDATVSATLERPPAQLALPTLPKDALVKLNGKVVGRGLRRVPVQRYETVRIEASLPGRATWRKSVYVRKPVVKLSPRF